MIPTDTWSPKYLLGVTTIPDLSRYHKQKVASSFLLLYARRVSKPPFSFPALFLSFPRAGTQWLPWHLPGIPTFQWVKVTGSPLAHVNVPCSSTSERPIQKYFSGLNPIMEVRKACSYLWRVSNKLLYHILSEFVHFFKQFTVGNLVNLRWSVNMYENKRG